MPWEQVVWMMGTVCSLLANVNRAPDKVGNLPAEYYPQQFFAPWILPGRVPSDSPSRRYPYKPPVPPPTPEELQTLAARWAASPDEWEA